MSLGFRLDLYGIASTTQTIIFCNTIRKVEWLKENLEKNNFTITCIHSKMTQQERDDIVKEFRDGKTRLLLTTDLLARGIDVQQVSIVINYDIPFKNESYIHRIGRSGRHGRTGVAINFVTNNDVRRIEEIAKYYSTTINPLPADLTTVFQNVN